MGGKSQSESLGCESPLGLTRNLDDLWLGEICLASGMVNTYTN